MATRSSKSERQKHMSSCSICCRFAELSHSPAKPDEEKVSFCYDMHCLCAAKPDMYKAKLCAWTCDKSQGVRATVVRIFCCLHSSNAYICLPACCDWTSRVLITSHILLITSHATDCHPKVVQIPYLRWLFRFLAYAETLPRSLSARAKYSIL